MNPFLKNHLDVKFFKWYRDPILPPKVIKDIRDRRLYSIQIPKIAERTVPSLLIDEMMYDAVLTEQPFILNNDHHTMEWASAVGDINDPQVKKQAFESYKLELERSKKLLQEELSALEAHSKYIQEEYDKLSELLAVKH